MSTTSTSTGPRTAELLDRVERVKDHLWRIGRQDADAGEHASDCGLWAMARAYDGVLFPKAYGALFGADGAGVDLDLMEQLRAAYESGRTC